MAKLPDPTASLDSQAQKLYDSMLAKRGSLDGMYRAMFNHPALVEHVGQLGSYLRFGATLPGDIRELAILLVARRQKAAYEWVKHAPPARQAGLSEAVIEAVRAEKDLGVYSPLYPKISETVDFVLAELSLPEALQSELEKTLGIPGILELVLLIGFYRMIAGFIFAFDVALPPNSTPPF